jgi:hypothetical protein
MAIKEIGELYLDEKIMKTGIIPSRNTSFNKKTVLFPDSERLLYNYSSDPNVGDFAYYNDGINERIVFIGKNVFIDYDGNTGNFYCDNPRYALRHLLDPFEDNGLALSQEDLFAVCENLKYAIAVDEWVYIVSKISDDTLVFFRYSILTRDVESVNYTAFNNTVGKSFLYCKMVEFGKDIFFFTYEDSKITVYTHNTVTNIFQKHNVLTEGLESFNSVTTTSPNTLAVHIDYTKNKMVLISCVSSNVIKVFDVILGQFDLVQNIPISLAGKHIVQSSLNDDKYGESLVNEYLMVFTDDNTATFFSKNYQSSLMISRITLTGTYGTTGIIRSKEMGSSAKYLIFYKKEDGTTRYATIDALSQLTGTPKYIPVSTQYYYEPILDTFSDYIKISGFFNYEKENLNLVFGSYTESQVSRPLIKQLKPAFISFEEHMFVEKGGLETSSGVIGLEGSSYGKTQLSRLHLYPEMLEEDDFVDDDSEVFLHESEDDNTKYTTGSYLWKLLHKIGLPFNTHVETLGRIIIDGYDIPISHTLITKQSEGEIYGDVLFTFDKFYNASKIKDSLHENISQYPGILFFKNRGFLSDAIISNSYDMEGSLTYNDDPQGDLFGIGINAITASCVIDNSVLLVAGSYGCLASINLDTMAYTNISGNSVGDSPPPYFKNYQNIPLADNIKAIIQRDKKIFILTNKCHIYKINVGTNAWEEISNPDISILPSSEYYLGNSLHYLNNRSIKGYEIKDNLLLISWPFGSLSSFDMDSEIYTSYTKSGLYPSTPFPEGGNLSSNCVAYDSLSLNERIYFVGETPRIYGKNLCWFDTKTHTFGYSKNSPSMIEFREDYRVNLTSDGKDVYLLINNINDSSLLRYDVSLDEFTVLSSSEYKHTGCGIYYYDNRIYALFGLDNYDRKYIQVYNIKTDRWISYILNNDDEIPCVFNAKGIMYEENVNIDFVDHRFAKILLFWGTKDKDELSEIEFSNLIEVDITSLSNISNSVSIKEDLDTLLDGTRLSGYSLVKDEKNGLCYIIGGQVYETTSISKKIYAVKYTQTKIRNTYYEENTNETLDEINFIDRTAYNVKFEDIPIGTMNSIVGTSGRYIYSIGGYINSSYDTDENLQLLDTRLREWQQVKSLSYFSGKDVPQGGVIPVITAMKAIQSEDMLVISYMDGGVGSVDLRTGNVYLPGSNGGKPAAAKLISQAPGVLSSRGAYYIYEDEEDVHFVCVNGGFKLAKKLGVFFKEDDEDSTDIKFHVGDNIIYPTSSSSQVAVGKYVILLNGRDQSDPLYSSHDRAVVIDTTTGKYEILGGVSSVKRYNAYSYYYNGFIYTFGGNCIKTEWNENTLDYTHETFRTNIIERYDLVYGKVEVLDSKYGSDVSDQSLSTLGTNIVVNLTPASFFGEKDDDSVLVGLITPNIVETGGEQLKQWFFFDLKSESILREFSLSGDDNILQDSVYLLCERKPSKELYSFCFHSPSIGSPDEYTGLTIYMNLKDNYNNLSGIEYVMLLETNIKVPLRRQDGHIEGLTDIIYNEERDTFVIPFMQKYAPDILDKTLLYTTIGYEYNPITNTISECARDGTNPIKFSFLNNAAIPLDKSIDPFVTRHDTTAILPVNKINGKYAVVSSVSEMMTTYTEQELFGHKRTIICDNITPWDAQQEALYQIFSYKDAPVEIANGVKPDRDACLVLHDDQIIRSIIIDSTHIENDLLRISLENSGIQNSFVEGSSVFLIIEYDKSTELFSVLHHEIILGLTSHSYSVVQGIIDEVLWTFPSYCYVNDYSVISYDFDTKSVKHHGIEDVISPVALAVDGEMPRCIINEEKKIVYIITINRNTINDNFTGTIYTFSNLNRVNRASSNYVDRNADIWDTLISPEDEYYLTTFINANGFVLNDRLYVDIFNGKDGEISYTNWVNLSSDGKINGAFKVKVFEDFIRSHALKDTTYIKTYNGIIQDIVGYKEIIKNGEKIISPVISLDSEDVLFQSVYQKTRTFIFFNSLNFEVPTATINLLYNENKEYLVSYKEGNISYIYKAINNKIYFVNVDEIDSNKYYNFIKSGFFPSARDIEDEVISGGKAIPIDKDNVLLVSEVSDDKGYFFNKLNTLNRICLSSNNFNYINQSALNHCDGDYLIVGNILYCVGSQKINNYLLTIIAYDINNGILLNVINLGEKLDGAKCIYNSKEDCIYIIGGIDSQTSQPNINIYIYNIKEKSFNRYLTSTELSSKVTDAYYNEELNKTFIEIETTGESNGALKIIDHNSEIIQGAITQINPIATKRLIETKNKALVYINSDLSLKENAHHIFDPVSRNYIGTAGNIISGGTLSNTPISSLALDKETLYYDFSEMAPEEHFVYQSNFDTENGWTGRGIELNTENGSLKCTVTDSYGNENIYIKKSFQDDISKCEISLVYSGEYYPNPIRLLFSDKSEKYLQPIKINSNTYKYYTYGHKDSISITGIKIFPSSPVGVVGGNIINIESIEIKKTNAYVTSGARWATGPLLYANATPSPIDDFETKRLFSYNGEIYLYGKEDNHEIHVYNKDTKSFDSYDGGIHSQSNIPDSSFYSSKVYLDGIVRFCFVNLQSQSEIRVSFVLYNIRAKELLGIDTVNINLGVNIGNIFNRYSLSVKPLWVSHYLIFALSSTNNNATYLLKIDLSTSIGISYNVTGIINSKSSLEWFYDRILSLGGSGLDGTGNADNHLDNSFDILSFRYNASDISSSVDKVNLGIIADEKVKSTFLSAKSAKKLSSVFLNSLTDKNKIVHLDDTTIDLYSLKSSIAGGNEETNGDKYMPYVAKHIYPKNAANEIQVPLFENNQYLSLEEIKPYMIPYKDNKVLLGVYDRLIDPSFTSDIPNFYYATKLRVAKLAPDLITIIDVNNYKVKIYSGITQDTIITYDSLTNNEINRVSFERDYGSVITGVERKEEAMFFLLYDASPAISTVIIHEDGYITVKRYDGAILGRTMDAGTNNHTIQEVDLTFLFDCESSEYDFRLGVKE